MVDTANIIHICFSIAKQQLKKERGDDYIFKEEDVPFFYHIFLRKIYSILSTYKNIIFACEGEGSLNWRRSVFPDYKMNRVKREDDTEYQLLKTLFPKIEKLLTLFRCKVLSIPGAEGDDVIYTLTKKYSENGENILVISSDGDFSQLLNSFDNVQVYTPMFKKYMEPKPNILMEKAIIGDTSDGIPGIERIGKKTLEKMLEDRTLWVKKMTPENERIYHMFLEIIDLSKSPKKIQDDILDKELGTEYNEFRSDAVEEFFFENNLKDCLMNWGRVSSEIELCLSSSDNKEVIDLEDLF